MAGFDTTNVAAETTSTPFSAVDTMKGLAELNNAQNTNKMFQARNLAGQYLEQSTGPDGQPDFNKFTQFLQSDPRTGPYAADILTAAKGIQSTGVSTAKTQQSLVAAQYGAARNIVGNAAIAAKNSGSDPYVAATSAMAKAANAGLFPAEMASGFLGTGDFKNTVDAAITSGDAGTFAQGQRYGVPTPVTTGAGVQFKSVTPGVGVADMSGSGAFTPASQSPSELGQMISYPGQNGSLHQIAKSAIQTPFGKGIPNVKDANGTPITDAKGALLTALAPEDMALLNKTAVNEADRSSDLQTAFEGSKTRKALVLDMMSLNGNFTSGPGAAKWSDIVTEANRILGTHFATDQTEAQQVFGKISEALSAQQRSTLGIPATNSGLQAAQLSSPNTEYSPSANQQVLAQFAGNEDLLQQKKAGWDYYQKHGGKSYNGYVKQFNQANDPRAFWDQYLNDDQRSRVVSGLSPALQAEYAKSKTDKEKFANLVKVP